MGCGKTSIGRHLARYLGIDFVDTDRFIEMQQKMTVAEIFEKHGESAFRDMEHEILSKLQLSKHPAIIATGGGMPCYGENMNIMSACGKVAYLKTTPQTLLKRLSTSQSERPLLKDKSEKQLIQFITNTLTDRESCYNRADFVVHTDNKLVADISIEIYAALPSPTPPENLI